ncbi:MAG: YfcE family phosphodiesterase [Oscillospiraceae bacterium]|jgi:putative phosphoesterase|nr:YfcE family phosphodiesterase [Oscillospiraceae bacterium]
MQIKTRILVFSDSHGDNNGIIKAIQMHHATAQYVFFCGDGAAEFEQLQYIFPNIAFVGVRGNCDWSCQLCDEETRVINGIKVICLHGHTCNVKYGTAMLAAKTRKEQATIAFYGHTHIAEVQTLQAEADQTAITLINPGAASGYKATYAIVDLLQDGTFVANIATMPERL